MTFSKRLWQKINPIYHDIVTHPFNVELAKGSLSKERFDFYIQQDVFYLGVLSKVFALISQRAVSTTISELFKNFSIDAQENERQLKKLFLNSNEPFSVPCSPACRDYSDYLLSLAMTASLEESVASILPCFWIYRELSRQMARITELGNPYFQWITLNASQEYSAMTDKVIALIDEISEKCSDKVFSLMEDVCASAANFELRFWNDAYDMQSIA